MPGICQQIGEDYHITTLENCQKCGIMDCPVKHLLLRNKEHEERLQKLEKILEDMM